mgnify:CR=1 FL=1
MNFNEWWESITEPERKIIGRTNAKYVWVCAQEAEREECAKVCEGYTDNSDSDHESHGYACAAAIRARGQA